MPHRPRFLEIRRTSCINQEFLKSPIQRRMRRIMRSQNSMYQCLVVWDGLSRSVRPTDLPFFL